jgi:hypothetical protein
MMYDSPAQIREGEYVGGASSSGPFCGSVAWWPKIRPLNSNSLIFFLCGIVNCSGCDFRITILREIQHDISKPIFIIVGAKICLFGNLRKYSILKHPFLSPEILIHETSS